MKRPRTAPGPRDALALMELALIVTKDASLAETEGCNTRRSRTRDLLVHGEIGPVVGPALSLTAREVNDLRPSALAELRSFCRACGLCAHHGLVPP